MIRAPVKHASGVKLSRLFHLRSRHIRLWGCQWQRQHVSHGVMGQCRIAATRWTVLKQTRTSFSCQLPSKTSKLISSNLCVCTHTCVCACVCVCVCVCACACVYAICHCTFSCLQYIYLLYMCTQIRVGCSMCACIIYVCSDQSLVISVFIY